jgi:hypothetical protein
MPRRNTLDFIENKAAEQIDKPRIGFVTKVYPHDGTQRGLSNHEVNVQLTSGQQEYRRIPIHTDHDGSIYVPQVGDAVEVGFLAGKTERPYVAGIIFTDEDRAPLGRPGHFRREFGSDTGSQLYIEAERADHSAGDPNVVRIGKKPDGLSDASTEVAIDDSGSEVEIRINTENGSITINDGTEGAITGISTTKDADGHVTDITIDRSDTVFIG